MLASLYAGRKPRGLHKLIIANSCPISDLAAKETERLFRLLPVSEDIIKIDVDEDYDNPAYQKACGQFSKMHFCLLDPWPAVLTEAPWEKATNLWKKNSKKGISHIRKPGFMRDYDAIKTAGDIEVPSTAPDRSV